MKSTATMAVLALALVLGACTGTTTSVGDTTDRVTTTDGEDTRRGGGLGQGAGPGLSGLYALQQFDECDALLTWIRAEAAEIVGPYGFNDGYPYYRFEAPAALVAEDAGGDDGAVEFSAPGTEVSGNEYSTTNVQEIGVDEPDVVKTDGSFLYVLADNELYTIAVDAPREVIDSIRFDDFYPSELLIGPDRLYVLANHWGPTVLNDVGADAIAPEYESPSFVIVEIRTDDGRLQQGGRLEVDGNYVTARQIGDGARIVVRHSPQDALPFVYPSSPDAEEQAAEVNRQVVLDSTLQHWLPDYRLDNGSEVSSGLLPECSRVRAPQEFSGMSTLSVLTLDMGRALSAGNALSLFGAGETVYASTTSLYTATFDYPDFVVLEDGTIEQNDDFSTALHQFDITSDAGAEYAASGVVPGHLLNQFAMSEHDGHLRVAVTEGSPWFCCSDEPSVSSVHVFAREGSELVEVGAVGDLGVDESIFGVRFVGDTGYVVTFRQTDPLYVIDLSNPAAPKTRGELKITGYSSYLHPVGDGLVIGVGQEATIDGATIGTKVSLFDVSDPADPREIDRWVEERSSSIAEHDHKAFLYWEAERIAVIPIDSWGAQQSGAIVLEVVDRSLVERARIRQAPPVESSLPPGCERLETATFEGTELEWLGGEGAIVVRCGDEARPAEIRGYACEPLEAFGLPDEALDDEIDQRLVSVCWPEHYDQGQIRRSVVTGDILWTVGYRTVQANDLGTFDVIKRITL